MAKWLSRSIQLAYLGQGLAPNPPRVGCSFSSAGTKPDARFSSAAGKERESSLRRAPKGFLLNWPKPRRNVRKHSPRSRNRNAGWSDMAARRRLLPRPSADFAKGCDMEFPEEGANSSPPDLLKRFVPTPFRTELQIGRTRVVVKTNDPGIPLLLRDFKTRSHIRPVRQFRWKLVRDDNVRAPASQAVLLR